MRSEADDLAIIHAISFRLLHVSRDFIDADTIARARDGRRSEEPHRSAMHQLDEVCRLVERLSQRAHRTQMRSAIELINTSPELLDAAQAAVDVIAAAKGVHDAIIAGTFADYSAEHHVLAERIKAKLVEAERYESGMGDARGVRRSAAWLVRCAALLLPAADRDRYREEFEAELLELVQEMSVRQLSHAVRLVVRVVPLRCELRRSAKERGR